VRFDAPIVTNRSRRHTGGGWNKTTDNATGLGLCRDGNEPHRFKGPRVHGRVQPPAGDPRSDCKHGVTLKDKDEIIVIETFIPLNKEYLFLALSTVIGALSLLTAPCSSRFRT